MIILLGAMFTQLAGAVDLPSSVAFTQTHSFPNGLKIEVTTSLIDEKDEADWVNYFQKELNQELKVNPHLNTYYASIETDEDSGEAKRSTSGSSRVKDFISKVTNSKVAVKFEKFVTGKAYAEWKLKNKDFLELNKVRIQATKFRFIFNTVIIGSAMLVTHDPSLALSVIAGATLVGSLSASSAWWFDFIADKIVGEPKGTESLAEKLQRTKLSQAIDKLKLGFIKPKIYQASAWVENSFNWAKVEFAFLAIIKLGFVALGIESFDGVFGTMIELLYNSGLGTLSQGEWERSIFYYRKQLITENADPILIQKKSQYLALAGSVLSVFGTVSNILHIQVAGYSPGTAVLIALGVGGVVHRLVRIHETKLIELGKKISNRCASKIEEPKKGIKKPEEKSDHSSIWVISPVQWSV